MSKHSPALHRQLMEKSKESDHSAVVIKMMEKNQRDLQEKLEALQQLDVEKEKEKGRRTDGSRMDSEVEVG